MALFITAKLEKKYVRSEKRRAEKWETAFNHLSLTTIFPIFASQIYKHIA
jgi:hypothetical protein